ncbi:MAG: fibrobacter succinogenes major paralogous domain-containing protein [Fibrobacter sp.]|nr:fibrobacter succinogenes major paralogous domain-containing protein [Fibrobacter sp.]
MKRLALTLALVVVFCAEGAFAAPKKGTMTDARDGESYQTVRIGKQIWMAENLKVKTEGSWCYEDKETNCQKYGRLYNWDAAKVACPVGWHLPSKEEFEILFKFVGGAQEDAWKWENAGKMLKSTNGWNEYEGKDGNGNDAFGFSALPAGYRNGNGDFNNEGNRAYFWSSTESVSGSAYYMGLDFSKDDAFLNSFYKTHGFSVRCVKD